MKQQNYYVISYLDADNNIWKYLSEGEKFVDTLSESKIFFNFNTAENYWNSIENKELIPQNSNEFGIKKITFRHMKDLKKIDVNSSFEQRVRNEIQEHESSKYLLEFVLGTKQSDETDTDCLVSVLKLLLNQLDEYKMLYKNERGMIPKKLRQFLDTLE